MKESQLILDINTGFSKVNPVLRQLNTAKAKNYSTIVSPNFDRKLHSNLFMFDDPL